ncbi:MAG: histidine kinase [Bryobacteraceae bacterium]|nr:histidine kinase [Bryobacteraceae bacterium]
MTGPFESRQPATAAEARAAEAVRYPGPSAVLLVLTAAGVLTSLRHSLGKPGAEQNLLALAVSCTVFYYPWLAFTPLVFGLEQRHPLGGAEWVRNALRLAAWGIPVSLAAWPLMSLLFGVAMKLLEPGFPWRPGWVFWPAHILTAQVLFWSSAAWGYSVRTQHELRWQQEQAARLALEKAELEASLRQAQLDAIHARLNPHFLFNSLQNISAMIGQDPQGARRMLARLGDTLRMVLRRDSQPETTLEEELALRRAYPEMEKIRLGGRLTVRFEAPDEVARATVPGFLLQPLVENAIRHGLEGGLRQGEIRIAAAAGNGRLEVRVEDNGAGLPCSGLDGLRLGVGLSSTRKRLAAMDPGEHEFGIGPRAHGGTAVKIRIPFRTATRQPAAGAGASGG